MPSDDYQNLILWKWNINLGRETLRQETCRRIVLLKFALLCSLFSKGMYWYNSISLIFFHVDLFCDYTSISVCRTCPFTKIDTVRHCDGSQLSKLWKDESLKRSNNRSTIELTVGVERWRARSPRYLEIFEVDHVLVPETQGWGCTLRLSHGKWHTRLLELIISLRQTFDISLSVYACQITESIDSTAIQLVPLIIYHQRIVFSHVRSLLRSLRFNHRWTFLYLQRFNYFSLPAAEFSSFLSTIRLPAKESPWK